MIQNEAPLVNERSVLDCLEKQARNSAHRLADAQHRFLFECGCVNRERNEIRRESVAWANNQIERLGANSRAGLRVGLEYFRTRREIPINWSFLDGDRHGARLPIYIETLGGRYVLKFGDVTPLRIVTRILRELSLPGLEFQLLSHEQSTFGWFIREWCEPASGHGDPNRQSYSLGVMIGLAMSLNIIDLHHENFVVTENSAFPIDLECVVYGYENMRWAMDPESIGFVSTRFGSDAVNGKAEFSIYTEPHLVAGTLSHLGYKQTDHHLLRGECGRILPLRDFFQDFERGVKTATEYCRNHRIEILESVAQADWAPRRQSSLCADDNYTSLILTGDL